MSKDAKSGLSDEFKDEISKERKHNKKNIFSTLLAIVAIILIFGTIGIAVYQLLQKQETGETKSASQKIISSPTVEQAAGTPTPTPTPAVTPTPTPTPTPATINNTNYTVVAGDTWSSIANANGMTSATLMQANGSSTENLQIGQVIKIPKAN